MKRTLFFIFACAAAAVALAAVGAGARQNGAKPGAVWKVTEIKEAGLKSILEASVARQRPLLINFWATWCGPCREEFPDLVKIREQYSPEALDFITISLDDATEIEKEVPAFLRSMRATRIPAYLLNADNSEAAIDLVDRTWHGELPATFLFDPQGKLAYKHMGRIKPDKLRAAIEAIPK